MLNDFLVAGRFCADLDSRYFESGAMIVSSSSFAVSRIGKDAPTDWLTIKFIGGGGNLKLPERALNTLQKGSQIIATGSFEVEQWTDKATGAPRQKPTISCRSFSYAGANKEGEKSPQIKGVNRLILAAKVASLPEVRTVKEGLTVASFKISLIQRNDVATVECVCFGKLAEQCGTSRHVGEMIILQGEVRINGEKQEKEIQIRADSITPVSVLSAGERLASPPATKNVPDYSARGDEPDYDDIPF
jgi:single-stranded DNA-binding protein